MNVSRLDETVEGMRRRGAGETPDASADSKPDEADELHGDCRVGDDAQKAPASPVNWMPKLLTGLVVLCLAMAAWVWIEILRLGP